MIPLKFTNTDKGMFYILYEGTGGNKYWHTQDRFMWLIHIIQYRGARMGTALTIFYVPTGNSVYLTIPEQKKLAHARKGNLQVAIIQYKQLAQMLGIMWEDMYSAYVEACMTGKKYQYVDPDAFTQEWEQKVKETQDHAECSLQV